MNLRPSSTFAPRALLASFLVAAAFLRLGGLDHGVRRGSAAGDEQHNFVAPILGMWHAPGPDKGVRPGYPGFFNSLAFFPVVLGEALDGERGAYVAARGLVAAFSVLNVFLVYRLGSALAGPWPGAFAAGLMAFSRGEVSHAHYVTPDLVVISGVLLVLLAVARPLTAKTATLTGVLCGLTMAIKYTAAVAVPAVAVALVRDRLPTRRVAQTALAAMVCFALAAPFALLGSSEVGAGIAAAFADYYSPTGYAAMASTHAEYAGATTRDLVVGYVTQNLTQAGLGLAAAGVLLFRPRVSLAPVLAALASGIAIILPAQIAYPRHVLVPSALLIVLAGCGLHALHDRLPRLRDHVRRAVVVALAALALFPPARAAFALAARFRAPDSLDQAGTWIEENVPGRPLVAAGYPRFALDGRFEVRLWARPAEISLVDVPPAVLRHYDLVVAPHAHLELLTRQGLSCRLVRAFDDGSVGVAFPEPPPATPIVPSTADASEAVGGAPGPWAGSSPWRSTSALGWISGEWESPRRVLRVEVVSDTAGGFTPLGVILEGRQSRDAKWRRLRAWTLRPRTLKRQSPLLPHGQVFVLDPPADLIALRIVGRGAGAWGLARISVLADPSWEAALSEAAPAGAASQRSSLSR